MVSEIQTGVCLSDFYKTGCHTWAARLLDYVPERKGDEKRSGGINRICGTRYFPQ